MAYSSVNSKSIDLPCGCAVSQEAAAVIVDFCKKHKKLKRPLRYAVRLIEKMIKEAK